MFEKKIKMTPLELKLTKNITFMDGYNAGCEAGRKQALSEKLTINTIREFLGLPIIETEGRRIMDAIKFIKLWKEMCDSYGDGCEGCPLDHHVLPCRVLIESNPEKAVESLEKWDEQRRPSMIDDFMKRDVEEIKRIIIEDSCPHHVGYKKVDGCCDGGCEECWNRKI
jgi:hypothetical protein